VLIKKASRKLAHSLCGDETKVSVFNQNKTVHCFGSL
jgi:hypothetical protein